MTCKDCIHYDVCYWFKNYGTDEYCVDCRKFKDKSRIVELPMPVAEWLRKELTEHCYERCIEEL